MREDELYAAAKELRAPLDVVRQTATLGELPVPNFSAGGVATPADASLMRQLGAQAVFVGSGIFKSENPERVARAIVMATTHWDNAEILAEVSTGLGEPMHGWSSPRFRRRNAWPSAAGREAEPDRAHLPAPAHRRSRGRKPRIGILAVQGDVREHADAMRESARADRGSPPARPRRLDALILPGGESTTMRRLIDLYGLREPIVRWRAVAPRCSGPAPA